MGQRIEELAALSLGMEGLSYLHSQHKDAGPIKECSCEYAKAFRVVSALRCKDSYEELKAKIRREARNRCLDEIESLANGESIEHGIGLDVERVYSLSVLKTKQTNGVKIKDFIEYEKELYGHCTKCGADIAQPDIPYAHKSVAGNIMPGHTDTEVPKEIKDLLWHDDEYESKDKQVNDRLIEAFRRGKGCK